MKTAYIFHDSFCDSFSEWYPWMKTTLEGMGYFVVVPSFPTPAGQSYESWKVIIKNHISKFDHETIFVGHGTGGLFALRLLEEIPLKINGLFLVASYAEQIGHAGYDRVNDAFIKHTFDWDKIRKHVMLVKIFVGENDPFVPMKVSENLADNLNEDLTIIPEGGHLNKASGFTQAVPIAQGIKESIDSLDKSINPISEPEENMPVQEPTGTTKGIEFDEAEKLPGMMPPKPAPETTTSAPATTQPVSDMKEIRAVSAPTPAPAPLKTHTMYQDMSSLVNSNRGTVTSSLLRRAHRDEKIKEEKKALSPSNVLYMIGTIIIILIVLGGLGYAASRPSKTVQKKMAEQKVLSLIQADDHQRVDIAGKEPYAIASAIKTILAAPVVSGSILDIYYTNGATRASFAGVLKGLGVNTLPLGLSDEFNQSVFMHGEGNFAGTTSHFLVVPITNYDLSFASMQNWEPTMFHDIGIFFGVSDNFLKTHLSRDSFTSEIISNQNIRVLRYHKPTDVTFDEPAPAPTESATTATPSVASPSIAPPKGTHTSTSQAGSTSVVPPKSETTTPQVAAPTISDNIQSAVANNPFANITAPYQENEMMLAYFFLNEKTLVITDNAAIIPQILARYAGSQIYK